MSQENVEKVQRMIQLANARDVAGVVRLMAADIECFPAEDQPDSPGFRGPEAFAKYAEAWLEVFDEYEIRASEYIDDGEYVVVAGRVAARGRESGTEVSDDEAWLWRFRDGEAIEYRECRTKARALEAAGLWEYAMSQEDIELVRYFFEAWNRRDVSGVLAPNHPDLEIVESSSWAPNASTYRGQERIRRYIESYFQFWDEFHLEPVEVVKGAAGTYALRVDVHAKGRKSGIEITRRVGYVYTFRDGRVVRLELYGDDDEAVEAMRLRK